MEGKAQVLTNRFIIGEEECLVLLDRPSARCSELVTMKGRNRGGVKVISSIKILVPQKPIGGAVVLVGPGPADGIDDSARRASVLCGIVGGLDGEFLNSIYTQLGAQDASRGPVRVVGGADTVDPVIIVVGAMAH